MREDVRRALTVDSSSTIDDRTIDITTTGRRSGQPRRIEIVFYRFEDEIYLKPARWRRSPSRIDVHEHQGPALPIPKINEGSVNPEPAGVVIGAGWQAPGSTMVAVRNLVPEGERVSVVFALVTEALARSTEALLSGDVRMGQGVVEGDPEINRLTAGIESSLWQRLKGEPPGWEDLRRSVGVLLILPELERSADLAEHIAQRALTGIGAQMTPFSRGIVQRMSEVALEMWGRAATGYAEGTVDCDDIDDA